MPIKIITGASGVGKTTRLFTDVINSAVNAPFCKHYVLVPEQATLQTEGRLVAMHPDHVLMNIEVLSFNKLAYRLYEYEGKQLPAFLNESGKSMLVRKAAEVCKKDLNVLKSRTNRPGMVSHIKTAISELTQYGISPEDLMATAAGLQEGTVLRGKTEDLSKLYSAYTELKTSALMSTEELQMLTAGALKSSDFLCGAPLYLDGFTGFTPVQYMILGELMRRCSPLMLTLTIPARESTAICDEMDLFSLTKNTIAKLSDLAQQYGIRTETEEIFDSGYSQERASALRFLSENFMTRDTSLTYDGDLKGLQFTACRTQADEAVFIAETIRRLVRTEGYRYRDFAVVSADLAHSARYLARAFKDADIPAFIDIKKPLITEPISVFLLNAIETIEKGYIYEPLMRYLRSGFCDISGDETDILENYILGTGISGRRAWETDFSRTYLNHENIDFTILNNIRRRAAEPLFNFHDRLTSKGHTYADACEAIECLFEGMKISEKLALSSKDLADRDDIAGSRIYDQIYKAVTGLLEQIRNVLGDKRYNIGEFKDVLRAGLSELTISTVPSVSDEVQTGDIRRSRQMKVKVLFLTDCNDGVLPGGTGSGVFTDEQRDTLQQSGLELAPTERQNIIIEQFYLSEHLNNPKDRLFFVYSLMDNSGDEKRPSSYIGLIKRLMGATAEERPDTASLKTPQYYKAAKELLALNIRSIGNGENGLINELISLLKADPKEARELKLITDAACFVYRGKRLDPETVAMLYGTELDTSITRLEAQSQCAYKAFLRYVLRLSPREEFTLSGLDRGLIIHDLTENFFREIIERDLPYTEIDKETRTELLNRAVLRIRELYGEHILKYGKDRYYIERYRRVTSKYLDAALSHLLDGEYRVKAVELPFRGSENRLLTFDLGNARMYINGQIDRLDERSDGTGIRVIDYKTGSYGTFDICDIYNGQSFQLMVYLRAAAGLLSSVGEQIPDGAYTALITDPLENTDGEYSREKVLKTVYEKLRPEGISISHGDDDTEYGDVTGCVLTDGMYRVLDERTADQIIDLGSSLLSGDITAAPAATSNGSACTYCDYRPVCCFDPRLEGCAFRALSAINKKDVLKLLKETADET